MRRKLKTLLFLGPLLTVLAATFAVWAATSGTASFNISVATGNGVTDGSVATVTDMGASVTGLVGNKAQKQVGVALKKIALASSSFSDQVVVDFLLTDPENIGKVFNNPNSFIQAQLYWLDSDQSVDGAGSDCLAERLSVEDGGTKYVCPDTGNEAFKYFTRINASGVIQSSKTGQDTFYLLAQIMVPGGVAQGQQSQLSTISFWDDVKRR